jgi:hypothetical protein
MRRSIALLFVSSCAGQPMDVGDPDGGVDAAGPDAAAMTPPTAAELRARIATCSMMIGGPFARDSGEPADISICSLPGGLFWTADLDIDCDGQVSAQCNSMTDPYFMDATAATDSHGQPLDSAALPFVVVPGKSTRFDFRSAGLAMGSVFAVVYEDRVEYGVVGDIGPTAIIGEASYRMAELLGIDPDPSTGGTEDEVAYIGFTGAAAIVTPLEDHDAAVRLGVELASELLRAP